MCRRVPAICWTRRAAPIGSPRSWQTVEHEHDVVAGARELLGGGGVEPRPPLHARLLGRVACRDDRGVVGVEAGEGRALERLRRDPTRCSCDGSRPTATTAA